jgi:FkbM family methyltransferase
MLSLLVSIGLVCLTSGCGESTSDGEAVTQQVAKEAAVVEAAKQPPQEELGLSNLAAGIANIRAEMARVPGRTGILAEKKLYSMFDEEIIIRDFFQDRRSGFFLDVGCAWPIRENNTYYLEKHLGWSGIGVDALSDFAPGWKRERPASKFRNFLVTDHSGTNDRFFKSWGLGLSSVDKRSASGAYFGDEIKVEEISVPSTTLNDLLEREGITKIDLLALDIEGQELPALRGIDLDRFRPELVIAEGKKDDVRRYLRRHGYELIERYLPFDLVNDYFQPIAK